MFAGLFVFASITYFASNSIPVYSLPSNVPYYSTSWAYIVPDGVLQLTYRNLSALSSYNSSAINKVNVFEFVFPKFNISSIYVNTLISLVFSNPNATVDIVILGKNYLPVLSLLSSYTPSKVINGVSFYTFEAKENRTYVSGWAFLIPNERIFGFSQGSGVALQALDLILEARNGTISNIMSNLMFREMFYVAGGVKNKIAFTYQNFPGLVRSGNATLQTVSVSDSKVVTNYVVSFVNKDYASSQINYFKRIYFTAQRFAEYDNFLVATKFEPISQLLNEFRAIG